MLEGPVARALVGGVVEVLGHPRDGDLESALAQSSPPVGEQHGGGRGGAPLAAVRRVEPLERPGTSSTVPQALLSEGSSAAVRRVSAVAAARARTWGLASGREEKSHTRHAQRVRPVPEHEPVGEDPALRVRRARGAVARHRARLQRPDAEVVVLRPLALHARGERQPHPCPRGVSTSKEGTTLSKPPGMSCCSETARPSV